MGSDSRGQATFQNYTEQLQAVIGARAIEAQSEYDQREDILQLINTMTDAEMMYLEHGWTDKAQHCADVKADLLQMLLEI